MNLKTKGNLSVLFVVIYTILYYAWITLWKGNHQTYVFLADIFQTLAPIITSIWVYRAYKSAKKYKQKTGEHFFLFIYLGTLCYFVGQIIWDYYDSILLVKYPFPGISDVFWILSILFYSFAVLYKLYNIYEDEKKFVFALITFDSIIIMCMALTVTFTYVIATDLYLLKGCSFYCKFINLLYPIGYLFILFGAINIYLSSKHIFHRKVLSPIALGFVLQFIAELRSDYLENSNLYFIGNKIDPLWPLSVLLLGLAALRYNYYLNISPEKLSAVDFNDEALEHINILPSLSILLLFIFMLFNRNFVGLVCSAISVTLVVIRIIFLLFENRKLMHDLKNLNTELEDKINLRTVELHNMAFYDHLTGLPNRRLFEDTLNILIDTAEKQNTMFAVMFIDLDRFKIINDTLGHAAGDLLLQDVAKRLTHSLNKNDIVSRQGGDEFTIIINDVHDMQDAAIAAEKILYEFSKPMKLKEIDTYIHCSIGIALYPIHGSNAETLMKHADTAMYSSKEKNGSTYRFYIHKMNEIVSAKLNLERDLHNALNNNEFLVYYQPQVDICTGKIIGAEALIRWMHPTHGIVSPSTFIPLAEETGLILDIGTLIFNTACNQMKCWHNKGYNDLKIGINVSPFEFNQKKFVGAVKQILQETGLSPQYLDLELTENIAMQDNATVVEKLNELKTLGVKISIDDFGTGYSSLSYLKKFPIDTLKIAQQFVFDIATDDDNKTIISAIIAMAHKLNLNLIAEGVETETQLNFLKSQNCNIIQGYFYSKPVPEDEFIKLLEKPYPI